MLSQVLVKKMKLMYPNCDCIWTLLENHEDNVRLRLLVKSIIKIMNLDER